MAEIINLGSIHNAIADKEKLKKMDGPFIKIKDFGDTFLYKKIFDPDEKITTKWELFIQKENLNDWYLVPGLLSNDYSIIKTENAIDTIKKQLGGNIVGEKHYRNGTTITCSFVLNGYELEYNENDKINRLLFNLITGIDVDVQMQKYLLSFNLINNLSGSHSLVLNYGFLTNLKTEDNKTISINNPYVFNEFESTLVHNEKLNVNYADVENVRKNISNKIDEFKKIPITNTFLLEFEKYFRKGIVKKVKNIWNEVTEDLQNLYYFSFIMSSIAQTEKRNSFDMASRKFISDWVQR